jgi:hypothetical protein
MSDTVMGDVEFILGLFLVMALVAVVAVAFIMLEERRYQRERLDSVIRPGNVQRKAPAFRFEQPAKGAKEYRQ